MGFGFGGLVIGFALVFSLLLVLQKWLEENIATLVTCEGTVKHREEAGVHFHVQFPCTAAICS